MANALYDKARESFANAGINWISDTIKVQLIHTASYTVNLASDQFLSTIASGARVGTPAILASKTNVAGVCDAGDATFTSLTGSTVQAVVIYKDSGVEATSPLIAYIDTGVGLPLTPTGINQTVVWDNGSNKIFKL